MFPEVGWQGNTRTTFSFLYKMDYNSTVSGVTAHTEIYATGTVNYYLENRRITEKLFVDENGNNDYSTDRIYARKSAGNEQ